MFSRGNRFLAGYGPFVRRFVRGYLLLCGAVLLALLIIDAAVPRAHVYGRIRDFLQASFRTDSRAPAP